MSLLPPARRVSCASALRNARHVIRIAQGREPRSPALVVIGVFAGLPAAILVAAPTIVLTDRSRSPGLGLFYTWYYAGMALLPGMAGWLQDRLGRAAAVDFAAAAVLTALVSYLGFRTVASVPELSRRRRSCRRAP